MFTYYSNILYIIISKLSHITKDYVNLSCGYRIIKYNYNRMIKKLRYLNLEDGNELKK
jgi:hypothetical protein